MKAEEAGTVTAVIGELKSQVWLPSTTNEVATVNQLHRTADGENTQSQMRPKSMINGKTNAACVLINKVMERTAGRKSRRILKHEGDRLTLLADNLDFGRIDIDLDGETGYALHWHATFIDEDGHFS